jgi:hypothetical protein
VTRGSHPLTPEEKRRIAEAERRIESRLQQIDRARADGRLAELVEEVPPVRDQLRPFLDAPA